MLYKPGGAVCKNLQNIKRNKTVNFRRQHETPLQLITDIKTVIILLQVF